MRGGKHTCVGLDCGPGSRETALQVGWCTVPLPGLGVPLEAIVGDGLGRDGSRDGCKDGRNRSGSTGMFLKLAGTCIGGNDAEQPLAGTTSVIFGTNDGSESGVPSVPTF